MRLATRSPPRKRDSKSLATGAAGEARRGKGGEERKRRKAKAPTQLRQPFLSTCLKLPVNSGDQCQAWAGPRDNTLFRLTKKLAEASNKCTWVSLGRTKKHWLVLMNLGSSSVCQLSPEGHGFLIYFWVWNCWIIFTNIVHDLLPN